MSKSNSDLDGSEVQDDVPSQSSQQKLQPSLKQIQNLTKQNSSRDSKLVYIPQADGSVTQIDFESLMKIKLLKQPKAEEKPKKVIEKKPSLPKIEKQEPVIVEQPKEVVTNEVVYEKLWGYNKVSLVEKMKKLHTELKIQKEIFRENNQKQFEEYYLAQLNSHLDQKRKENNQQIIQREPIRPAKKKSLFDRDNRFLHVVTEQQLETSASMQSSQNIGKCRIIPWRPGKAVLQNFEQIEKTRSSSLQNSAKLAAKNTFKIVQAPKMPSSRSLEKLGLEQKSISRNNQQAKSQQTFITAVPKIEFFTKQEFLPFIPQGFASRSLSPARNKVISWKPGLYAVGKTFDELQAINNSPKQNVQNNSPKSVPYQISKTDLNTYKQIFDKYKLDSEPESNISYQYLCQYKNSTKNI